MLWIMTSLSELILDRYIKEMFEIELDDIINEFLVQFVSGFKEGVKGE